MSTSNIPSLQPGSARKKKRKYTNWDTQFYVNADGQPVRRASRRASMLVASMRAANASKNNDAISSNATLHVPLPDCASSQQSHVPLPDCMSSQQSDVPLPSCESSQQSHVPLPDCTSTQQSDVPLPSCESSQQSHVPLPACKSSQQLDVTLPACESSQQSDVRLPACASNQQSHVPLPNCPSSQQSDVPSPSCASSQQPDVPLPFCESSQQSDVPLPFCESSQQSHVPLPSCASSQQSQTPISSSSYLHSSDCNLVCEYCGSYFWHGERVITFSNERPLKYIRCCKGATSDTVAEEFCSGSTLTKQRLCSGQGSGENVQQSGAKDKIESSSSEIHNHILPYVNKLHDHRNRGQNAVFFDGQDRLVKVVSFVSSLLDNIKKPILVIASSSALWLWEMEFSKWSKSINVVTYKGAKDIRAAIRGSEFQVLLSSPDAIVEDMETVDHIKWELLVIDACQRPVISMHLKKIQMLKAAMKLLTVSGEPVDISQSYQHILSLVDCKTEKMHPDADMEMNNDISILKERLSPFIVFECKFSTPDLEEYWVPVHLSSMQIKQYCSILASNLDTRSSLSRTSSLNDVITQIQKCCDHPYLVDPTLHNSPKEPSLIDPLAAEIDVSGKLHVFYKLLLEIKRCGLRALVLFHSAVNSEKISIGRFLADLVHQRFGENSYVYIPGWILSHSAYVKKEEALEMFNKDESDRFICLCDHLACLSSLRLSHVDVVILFNSYRNPSNDIKSLKRMTINSHCERLIVFRLYSAFTIEEKALILSKQGTTGDAYFSWSVCHQLLAWGATYLFGKLQSGTDSGPQSFINDLVHELSSLLRNTSAQAGPSNRSIIANAHMQIGAYSGSTLLFGETETPLKESSSIDEYLIDNQHSVFWSNLFQQSQPVPENSCSISSTLAEESCSGSMHKKRRLCSGQGSGESVQQSGTKDEIESDSSELADIQVEVSTKLDNHVLPYVNKLRDHWNRGQNVVFFDGQDRLAKVASFVSSLLDNMKKSILIITSSSALLLWKIELSKWSKSISVVTYKGTRDIRAAIRGSKFQVLLSSPDAIVEDMEMLDHIKWELLVIDECQRPVISIHLKKMQMLAADMKLLTVSGEPVDILQSYRNILSLLDCKNEETQNDADTEMNDDISTLKERLSPFIAFECKFSPPDLEEYWVPVHLSSMQIKQYCLILVSNLDTLFSLSRTSSLNDVVTQIQKCCDHPYLMDPTLRNSPKEASLIDPLAAEIDVSGKLHVFDKLMSEIKRCGLRALVLFHSTVNSEKTSTGHFLDNLVRQRFGENSYVYIPGWILSHSALVKKKESLEMFNKADSDRFICLCDHLACLSSLRLSRVDVVILFNSDRNPSNDIKSLKRITIDSHCERINVFRLYSAFTVEEKALIFSKQGKTVDSHISWSVCQQLLAWGAAYLFSKLQSRTDSGPQSFIYDLVHELSSLLRSSSVETGHTNHSIISNAHMQNGAYSGSILLYGEIETHTKESSSIDEYLIDKRHTVFWDNLVNQSQLVPKNSCSRSSTNGTLAEESCSGSMQNKERLSFGQGSGECVQQSGTKGKIESGGSELARIQFVVSNEMHNHVLPYVNKLRDHRNRGQNAVFFDGQDRLAKVAYFVSSLRDNMKKPILIIASSSALLLWEMEFLKWSKLIKVVTYRGTKDIRAAIRGSEFQVLLSSTDAIVEDMETLDHMKWELLVIDECQRPVISVHLKKIQMLMADMKLLTVSSEPVDILQSYQNILSLVDDKNEELHTEADMEMNNDIGILKERLSPFIAFECNLKRAEKETSPVKVLQIPASELVRSKSPYLTSGLTTCLPGHSLAGSGLRLPAPHLRSSPPMSAPLRNQPASGEPSLEPLPSLSATQTVDKNSPV